MTSNYTYNEDMCQQCNCSLKRCIIHSDLQLFRKSNSSRQYVLHTYALRVWYFISNT